MGTASCREGVGCRGVRRGGGPYKALGAPFPDQYRRGSGPEASRWFVAAIGGVSPAACPILAPTERVRISPARLGPLAAPLKPCLEARVPHPRANHRRGTNSARAGRHAERLRQFQRRGRCHFPYSIFRHSPGGLAVRLPHAIAKRLPVRSYRCRRTGTPACQVPRSTQPLRDETLKRGRETTLKGVYPQWKRSRTSAKKSPASEEAGYRSLPGCTTIVLCHFEARRFLSGREISLRDPSPVAAGSG